MNKSERRFRLLYAAFIALSLVGAFIAPPLASAAGSRPVDPLAGSWVEPDDRGDDTLLEICDRFLRAEGFSKFRNGRAQLQSGDLFLIRYARADQVEILIGRFSLRMPIRITIYDYGSGADWQPIWNSLQRRIASFEPRPLAEQRPN